MIPRQTIRIGPSLAAALLISVGLLGCGPRAGSAWSGLGGSNEQAVRAVLAQQADDWNEGDIEGFMRGYWKSDQLRFCSGGKVTRGWQATLDGYRVRYASRAKMGRLTFDQLVVSPLADDVVFVVGRWKVTRDNSVGGMFTLIFRRIEGQWLIIHDHTSVDSS